MGEIRIGNDEVNQIIQEARERWAYDGQWKFTWEWTKEFDPRDKSGSMIVPGGWTEKKAYLKLDERIASNSIRLRYEIYHELGHPIVAPIWRGVSDWSYIKNTEAEDLIFEEMVNTRENEVIDHIVVQIFKIPVV